ncbi:MAG: hypothetical protein JSW55_05790 [Chloroflexota bacterium]|nr:MAG: hypothetical protein JSW55_05790 [Chloroflexota bacterium]
MTIILSHSAGSKKFIARLLRDLGAILTGDALRLRRNRLAQKEAIISMEEKG